MTAIGNSPDRRVIEYSCNECGDEFEIFRDLAKHKRAAQCRREDIEFDEDLTGRMEDPSPTEVSAISGSTTLLIETHYRTVI